MTTAKSRLDLILDSDSPSKSDLAHMYELLMGASEQIKLRDQHIRNQEIEIRRMNQLLKRRGR